MKRRIGQAVGGKAQNFQEVLRSFGVSFSPGSHYMGMID